MTEAKPPKKRKLPLLNGQRCPRCSHIGRSLKTRYTNGHGKPLDIPVRYWGCPHCAHHWWSNVRKDEKPNAGVLDEPLASSKTNDGTTGEPINATP